jgi:hypothetical protein
MTDEQFEQILRAPVARDTGTSMVDMTTKGGHNGN